MAEQQKRRAVSMTAKAAQTDPAQTSGRRYALGVARGLRSVRERLQAATSPSLFETLQLQLVLAACVLGQIACGALHAGEGRIALLMYAAALVCFEGGLSLSRVGRKPDPLVQTGKGEVANLSHEEFERLVERAERSAAPDPARLADDRDHFAQLVAEALDELPGYLQATLADNVAVIISEDGGEHGYYGLYSGGAVAYRDEYANTIFIYRDTLTRDFGHDPEQLRRQVTCTVRHELAHHLGASERRVAQLGL